VFLAPFFLEEMKPEDPNKLLIPPTPCVHASFLLSPFWLPWPQEEAKLTTQQFESDDGKRVGANENFREKKRGQQNGK
jgi:hypothetical protein